MTSHGFVFAATGPDYTALARQAAASLRPHCPDIPIDLFTDQPVDDPVFARVHSLNKSTHRPRMESLLRSRFDHTICLDSDVLVLADISDMFEVLGRFDIALAHDQDRNGPLATTLYRRTLPAAFPQFNGGVMGVARNHKTDAFLNDWQAVLDQTGAPRDQPSLRELLFDSDLRICTLPPEYNLYDIDQLRAWTSMDTAPRLLHHYHLHAHLHADIPQVRTVQALLGAPLAAHVKALIGADRYLSPDNHADPVPAFCDRHPGARLPNPYRKIGRTPAEKLRLFLARSRGAGWIRAAKKRLSLPKDT